MDSGRSNVTGYRPPVTGRHSEVQPPPMYVFSHPPLRPTRSLYISPTARTQPTQPRPQFAHHPLSAGPAATRTAACPPTPPHISPPHAHSTAAHPASRSLSHTILHPHMTHGPNNPIQLALRANSRNPTPSTHPSGGPPHRSTVPPPHPSDLSTTSPAKQK